MQFSRMTFASLQGFLQKRINSSIKKREKAKVVRNNVLLQEFTKMSAQKE